MDWVRINKDDENNDKPRFLTEVDIQNILKNYINNPQSNLYFKGSPAADSFSQQLARKGTIDWIVSELRKVQLCPSLVPKLLYLIIQTHYKSLVAPGTPIAIGAGQSVGATTTQMTLNSVAPWEKLLIQSKNGVGEIVEIGKWIDLLLFQADPNKIVHVPENRTEYLELSEPVKIVTTDNVGNVTWENVTAVTRHLPVGDLVKIVTKSGREVTATQQKSFLIWDKDDEMLVVKDGKKLQIGDLVPIANEIPEPDFVYQELELKNYLDKKEWIFMSEMEKLNQDYLDYKVPGKRNFWKDLNIRLVNVPYNRGDSFQRGFSEMIKKNVARECVYPKSWGGSSKTNIPEKIVLDRRFGVIVGLYLAEGCATDTFVCISNNAPEIRQIVYDWCDSVGVTHHTVTKTTTEGLHKGTSTDVKIHSVLFARLFKLWMGTGSAIKTMPEEILFGNREFIIGVLDGYFAGDGSVNKNDGSLSISSVSEALIDGFMFLCSRLGIFGRKSKRQETKNNKNSQVILPAYICTIRALNTNLWYKIIGSCHAPKQEKMNVNYPRKAGWGMEYFKHKNIMLDPIISIEFVSDVKQVYDLTVPKTLNFSLYNGLNLIDTFHLSGSAVSASFGIDSLRDVIYARKTPKNEGCTIYYKNKYLTYEEVLNTRSYIVGTVISDLISDYDIDTPVNIKGGEKWWTKANLLFDNELPDSTLVLRLFLNRSEMYKHKITIKQIADILQREITASKPSVVVRYGSMKEAIIDIYPSLSIPDTIKKELYKNKREVEHDELAESTYLESIVYPELKNIRIKGIKGLRNLTPRAIPVWSIVSSEIKNDLGKWVLNLNEDKMYLHGLNHDNIIKLCLSADIKAYKIDDYNVELDMPNDTFRTKNGEIVIDLKNVKYRKINITDHESSNIMIFDKSIYEKLDDKKIKSKPSEKDQYYEIIIEDKIKLPVGPKRWIEKEIPEIIIKASNDVIINFGNEYFMKISDVVTINNNNVKVVDINDKSDIKYLGNIYQDLTNTNIYIDELKPSEYINFKITEAKASYRDQVTKKTNEIIESEKDKKRYQKKIVKHIVKFPILGISSSVQYNKISNEVLENFLKDNKTEITESKELNLIRAINLVNSTNYVNLPNSINEWLESSNDIKINQIGEEEVEIDEDVSEEIKNDLLSSKPPLNIDRPKILKMSELIIADVDIVAPENDLKIRSKMFKILLGLHHVDKRRTTCNNMHTLASVIGIEAAREFIIMQLHGTISNNSSYVHPAHIMFIAEFITSRGVPYGTTFTGISRQPGGHLSLATVERAGKTFTQHALHGRKEDIRNVSASISVGARMVIGNGTFDVAQNIIENGKEVTLVNDDVFKANERDESIKEEVEETTDYTEPVDALDLINQQELVISFDSDETNLGMEISNTNPDIRIGYVQPPTRKKHIIPKIVKKIEIYQPIISEGLVVDPNITPGNIGTELPTELMELLNNM